MRHRPYLHILGAVATVLMSGCHTDMWIQPSLAPQQQFELFENEAASRVTVDGTIPFGTPDYSDEFMTGRDETGLVNMLPFVPTLENIHEGEEDYRIHCAPCHGIKGDGQGMIAQRGFDTNIPVASFQTDRMRDLPIGHTFEVLTAGFGAMPSFASRLSKQQRWQIALYIRVLQTAERADSDLADQVTEELANGL